MLEGEAEIAAVLRGVGLGEVQVAEVRFGGHAALAPPPRPGAERAFVVRCDVSAVDVTWEAAAAVVESTGRWPIATATFDGEPLATSLWGSIVPTDSLPDPLPEAELDERLASLVETHDSIFTVDEDDLAFDLERTADRVGTAPSSADVHRSLGEGFGAIALESWLLRWEVEHTGGQLGSFPDGHLAPYRPDAGQCGIVLLPAAAPWRAAAMLPFYGVAGQIDVEVFVSLLHRWHRRWGAEVVASYDTLLDMKVHFPPSAPEDLLALAIEHTVLASDTLRLPGVALRDHARALANRPAWHLHARP